MNFKLWNDYEYISQDLAITLDKRLKNIVDRMENFFRNSMKEPFKDDFIEFYLAGSCIKRDTFRDIDMFFKTKERLEEVLNNIEERYFLYKNNSDTYSFEDDLFQCVFRERFLNKNLNYVIDIFDFSSTKIGFTCRLNTKTNEIEIIESDIREEFIDYLKNKRNNISRINKNPFVSLQRALHFSRNGDYVPFGAFLNIFFEIIKIDPDADYEKCFQRLQGDGQDFEEVKKAIEVFLEERKKIGK